MGKSSTSDSGIIHLLDDPETVRRKVSRAVTDNRAEVIYDPDRRPGVSNLLEILAAFTRDQPDVAALVYRDYAELKEAATVSIVDALAPLQARYCEIVAEPGYLERVRREGAERARERAAITVARAKQAIGLSS
jgi:tryptophanyl-tRNA synthetase